MQRREETRERRKEGGDQWRILKSNRAASDLVSLFLAVRHRQENRPCVMLTLPASCPKCTGLMYVPATHRPAALYLTPGHPFLAIQNLSKPTHPTLSSSVQVLKYRATSEGAFSNVLFSGCLPPQCVLTPRPLPV